MSRMRGSVLAAESPGSGREVSHSPLSRQVPPVTNSIVRGWSDLIAAAQFATIVLYNRTHTRTEEPSDG